MRRWHVTAFATGVVIAAACSNYGGDDDTGTPPRDDRDAAEDGPGDEASTTDAADAAANPPCDPVAPFRTPQLITELNTSSAESNPRLTPDELTIYFESAVGGQYDIYVAERARRDDAFGTPQIVANVNDPVATDGHAWISPNRLHLVFTSRRGDAGQWELYENRRLTTVAQFTSPEALSIDTTDVNVQPYLDPNETELWFASDRGGGPKRVWRAATTSDGGLATPESVDLGASADSNDDSPTITADGRTLYFSSDRADPRGGPVHTYVTRRASKVDAWGPPEPVTELHGAGADAPGWISSDSCRLYFWSSRLGSADLYVASRPPSPG